MTSAQDLIAEARAARASNEQEVEERRKAAQRIEAFHKAKLERQKASRKAEAEERSRAAAEEQSAAEARAQKVAKGKEDIAAGLNTVEARFVADLHVKVVEASTQARRAGDLLNITGHTKRKKKEPALKRGISMTEIKDPSDGGRIRVMKRFGESTIDNWERSKKISPEAKEAADWFRARAEAAGIGSVSSIDFEKPLVDGGVPVTERSVGAILAADDVKAARDKIFKELARVGPPAYGAMEDVVVHGLSLDQVAARWTDQTYRMGAGEMFFLVRHALNIIAEWRQLIATPKRKMEEVVNERGERDRKPAAFVSHEPVTSFVEREVDHRGDMVETSKSRILREESSRRVEAEKGKRLMPLTR